MKSELHVHTDAEALASAAADEIARTIASGVKQRSGFTLVLAGGSTPRRTYELLAERHRRIAWDDVHVFWGDERCVPAQDPESNYGAAKTALLDRVPIPAENVHRIRGELTPLDAAEDYERDLRTFFGLSGPASFDLVLLGMGDDGHTASLFPGDPVLAETVHWTRAVDKAPKPPRNRVTLTFPALGAARDVMFLVAGASKRAALAPILAGAPAARGLPAAAVRPQRRLLWYVTADAAPE